MARGLSTDGVGRILLDAARTASDFTAWQAVVFEAMEEIGCDVAFVKVMPPVGGFASRGFEQGLLHHARTRWPHYQRELLPLTLVSQREGVATDHDVLGPGRRRLAYYREIVQPSKAVDSTWTTSSTGTCPWSTRYGVLPSSGKKSTPGWQGRVPAHTRPTSPWLTSTFGRLSLFKPPSARNTRSWKRRRPTSPT